MGTVKDRIHGGSFQCISCFWYVGRISSGIACYAFPTGIPLEIIEGKFDHRDLYPGYAGILWHEEPGWARPIEEEVQRCRQG